MPLLSFSPQPAKGVKLTVTLDKSYLVSMPAVAQTDSYFADPLNIKSVVITYQSNPGTQKYTLTFDFTKTTPTAFMTITANSRNNFYLNQIILNDFEKDKITLKRSQIVLSDESISDLDISFGAPEQTGTVAVTPAPANSGTSLKEDMSRFFVEKTGSTMTGALTLSGAPTQNLHAATKAYTDAEQARAEAAEVALDARLDTIEGSGEGSVAKALVDAKAYTDAEQARAEAAEVALDARLDTIEGSVLPAGTILPYAGGGQVPSGFLLCNGGELSRAAHPKLFSVIGTSYGAGNGTTTFNLPDLRGRFIRGVDAGKGIDPNRVLGSFQDDSTALPRNTFTMQTEYAGTHYHTFVYNETSGGGGDQGSVGSFFGGVDTSTGNQSTETVSTRESGIHTHNIRIGREIVGNPHYPQGGDAETRPYNIALNFIIKY